MWPPGGVGSERVRVWGRVCAPEPRKTARWHVDAAARRGAGPGLGAGRGVGGGRTAYARYARASRSAMRQRRIMARGGSLGRERLRGRRVHGTATDDEQGQVPGTGR